MSASYVNNDNVSFDLSLSNGNDQSKFIYLFRNGYLNADFSVFYNNKSTAISKGSYSGNFVTSSVGVSNVTDADKEAFTVNVSLSYSSDNYDRMKAYLSSAPSNTDFSFTLSVEVTK